MATFFASFHFDKGDPQMKKKLEMKWKINRGQVTNETHTLLQVDQWTPVSDLVG